MNPYTIIKKTFLLIGDLAVFFMALWLTLLLRHGSNFSPEIWHNHLQLFSFLAVFWVVIFYAFNLYHLHYYPNLTSFINVFAKALIINVIITIVFFYIFGIQAAIAPKTIIAIDVFVFSIIFGLWRYLFQRLFKLASFKQRLLIYGINPHLESIINDIKQHEHLFHIVGCYIFSRNPNIRIPVPMYSIDYQLTDLVKKEQVDAIVLAEELNTNDAEDLTELFKHHIDVFTLPKFYETFFQKIPVKFLKTSWFLENLSEGKKRMLNLPKRLVDIIAAVLVLLPSAIILPILALIIKITSSGPILFKQVRTGKDGKTFLALKLRTMTTDAEKNGPQWAQKNDARITNVGKYLRKLRLDEIPQLFNIIRGEMSFVGPRPERPEFDEQIEKEVPYYRYRHLVKPGLTGWAQINYPYGASIEDARIKLEYDLYYIKNRSLLLDLSTIIKTINTVLRGWG